MEFVFCVFAEADQCNRAVEPPSPQIVAELCQVLAAEVDGRVLTRDDALGELPVAGALTKQKTRPVRQNEPCCNDCDCMALVTRVYGL